MAESIHPLPVGQRVYHSHGQQWAMSLLGGTAIVREVIGPDHRGDYEYVVDGCREFSRQPGPDNPMDKRTQWASYTTMPAMVGDGEADDTVAVQAYGDAGGYGFPPGVYRVGGRA